MPLAGCYSVKQLGGSVYTRVIVMKDANCIN